jgi:hypothetical protein
MELYGHLEKYVSGSGGQKEKKLDDLPSEFSMILGIFPSITATAEFVVPNEYQVSTQSQSATVAAEIILTKIDTNDRTLNLLFSAICIRSHER